MGRVLKLRVVRAEETSPQASPPVRAPARALVRAPELAELRAFCTAVDLGSIGRAARLFQVSQPALSKRLQGLEAVAGTTLLQRSTRGVTPTAAGARLYSTARRLLAEADSVEELMRGFSTHTAPVRVVASPTIADWWLPAALVSLEGRHERHLSVEVITANSNVVRDMVRTGRCDIGLAAVDPDETPTPLTETVVWSDEVVVGVPRTHRWAVGGDIDREDFAATPIIRRDPGANSTRIVESVLGSAGLAPVPPLAEIGSNVAARATAMAENAPVLLPFAELEDEGGTGGLIVKRVAGLSFAREFALILGVSLQDLAAPARTLAQHLLSWQRR